jgi:hypothetical protein
MSKQNFDADLKQQLNNIQKTRLPERDLWAGIEHGLNDELTPNQLKDIPEKRVSRAKLYGMAAALAFVGLFSWYGLDKQQDMVTGQQLVAALSSQHAQQKDALLVKFKDQPALTQNWQQQLDELDAAALAIKKALEQEQNNVALLKMLQKVHQQQIELIERVHSPKWQQI